MRIRQVVALTAVFVLVVPAAASAQGERQDQDKVTGGGQVLVDTDDRVQGPGDTLGFVAISTSDDGDAARGRLTRVETSMAGGGEGPRKFFGDVTCLTVDGDTAQFGGVERDEGNQDGGQPFTVDVIDNGQGNDADDDLIRFRETDEPCEDDGDDRRALARGNLTVHDTDS